MRSIAIDLGASSGRVIAGDIENNKIQLSELYRFSNSGQLSDEGLIWDLSHLFEELVRGLRTASEGLEIESIAIDSWGVDYVLLNSQKMLVLKPYHYRNDRTKDTQQEIEKILPRKKIFATTGIQFMEINTLNQLFASMRTHPKETSMANHFLMIADYFTFLLTGIITNEYSNASTTQLLNVHTNEWAYPIIKQLGLSLNMFHSLTMPGTKIGFLRQNLAKQTGLSRDVKIIATASHDTAAAIAAVPCDMNSFNQGEWIYISSGTWSLIGIELDKPIINSNALAYNFTNEKGIQKSVHFLKNITGMWIIQGCKQQWNKIYTSLTWDDINNQAKMSESFNIIIDIMHPDFLNPENMLETVLSHIHSFTPLKQPTIGQISRIIYESMVRKYCEVIHQIEEITQIRAKIIHIVGGGSQISLLNQMVADCTKLPVISGPVEATAIGNILIQAIPFGIVSNLSTIRQIVRNSFPSTIYTPKMES